MFARARPEVVRTPRQRAGNHARVARGPHRHRQRKARFRFRFRFRRFRRSGSAPNGRRPSVDAQNARTAAAVSRLRAREHVRVVPQRAPRVRGAAQRHRKRRRKRRVAMVVGVAAVRRRPPPRRASAAADPSTGARRSACPSPARRTRFARVARGGVHGRAPSLGRARVAVHAVARGDARVRPRRARERRERDARGRPFGGPDGDFRPPLSSPRAENVTKTPGGTRMEPLMEPCDAPSRVFARGMLARITRACFSGARAPSPAYPQSPPGPRLRRMCRFAGRGASARRSRAARAHAIRSRTRRCRRAATTSPPSCTRGVCPSACSRPRPPRAPPRASRSPRARGTARWPPAACTSRAAARSPPCTIHRPRARALTMRERHREHHDAVHPRAVAHTSATASLERTHPCIVSRKGHVAREVSARR